MEENVAHLFELFKNECVDEAIRFLEENKIDINVADSSSTTLLNQAAWKGNVQLVDYLLSHGADPNCTKHENGYTALMFAAIGGHTEICRKLLDADASTHMTNSVGRTAAEMAAFVGQHECVSIINNYVTLVEIEKLVHPLGKDSDIIYPEELSHLLHTITMTHEIHPVKILFFMHEHDLVWQHRKKFLYVMDRLFERQLRCKQGNEVMSLKLWIIFFTVQSACRFVDKQLQEDKISDGTSLHILQYARYLLKMEPNDSVRPNLERHLRNSVQAFPYHQAMLFHVLIKELTRHEFGKKPEAYYLITHVLFGPRMAETAKFCSVCGVVNSKKRCPLCRTLYCGQFCRKFDWANHKKCCVRIAERKEKSFEANEIILPLDNDGISIGEIDVNQKSLEGSTNNEDINEAGVEDDEKYDS